MLLSVTPKLEATNDVEAYETESSTQNTLIEQKVSSAKKYISTLRSLTSSKLGKRIEKEDFKTIAMLS